MSKPLYISAALTIHFLYDLYVLTFHFYRIGIKTKIIPSRMLAKIEIITAGNVCRVISDTY